jgi:hypothetical protein
MALPNQQISITMTAQDWTNVLNLLSEAPYRVSAPLINTITQQAAEAEAAATRGNGTDETFIQSSPMTTQFPSHQ